MSFPAVLTAAKIASATLLLQPLSLAQGARGTLRHTFMLYCSIEHVWTNSTTFRTVAEQATLVWVLASPAAENEPADYAAHDDSPPMPGVHQESFSDTVCATLVWALAFRLSLVDPELVRLWSHGVSYSPDP